MKIRFYIDSESGEPHTARHHVREQEAEEILARPIEDRPGAEVPRGPWARLLPVDIFVLSMCRIRSPIPYS